MQQNLASLFRMDKHVALVVGAASGIGRAAALGLANFGAVVACADLKREAAESVAADIRERGGQAAAFAVDITDEASVARLVADVERQLGTPDALVTTPSINVRKPILQYSGQEFDRVVGLNLKGTFHLLQAVGQAMLTRGSGSIIVLSSIRALVVEPGQGVYAATKAGLVQLVRTLAAELSPHGVRVNAIAPGVVDTPLTEPIKRHPAWAAAYAEKTALGRWARVEELVGPVVFLASDASSYVTGTVLFVDGGWTAVDGRFQPPL
jgi:NAD(P)-dependent dehydrogenase (short-subunit alcohol dehydrogenase family)